MVPWVTWKNSRQCSLIGLNFKTVHLKHEPWIGVTKACDLSMQESWSMWESWRSGSRAYGWSIWHKFYIYHSEHDNNLLFSKRHSLQHILICHHLGGRISRQSVEGVHNRHIGSTSGGRHCRVLVEQILDPIASFYNLNTWKNLIWKKIRRCKG